METVNGVVEAVGTKFNGSVKLNGDWFNFKKGVDYYAVKKGQNVTLFLEPWAFNGKSGRSITKVELLDVNVAPEVKTAPAEPPVQRKTEAPKGRDFDKEARGKTVCQYVAALLSNPSSDLHDLDGLFAKAHTLMEKTFEV